jgi:hypothetical protein
MGLGKTIQIIALFTALFEKKGDSTDLSKITEQGRQAERFAEKEQLAQRNKYLDESKSAASSSQSTQDLPPPPLHKYAPVLLVVPASVVDNWMVELNKWGHFSAFKSGCYSERASEAKRACEWSGRSSGAGVRQPQKRACERSVLVAVQERKDVLPRRPQVPPPAPLTLHPPPLQVREGHCRGGHNHG